MRYIKSHFIKESNVPIPIATKSNVNEILEEIKSRVGFYDFKEGVEDLKSMIELDDDEEIFSFPDHWSTWNIKSSTKKIRKDSRSTSANIRVIPLQTSLVNEVNKLIRVSELSDSIRIENLFKISVEGAFLVEYNRRNPYLPPTKEIIKSTKYMVDQLAARSRSEGYEIEYFDYNQRSIEISKIDYKKELNHEGNPSRMISFKISKKLDKNPFKVDFDIPNDKLDRFNEFAKKYRISNADKLEIINLFKN
jgi:hypothetical protein